MFEKDLDQSGVPDGLVAYIVRSWGQIMTGVVSQVRVTNGLPHMTFVSHPDVDASVRPATFPGEVSRVFVMAGARIDPLVFAIGARPVPATIEGHFRPE